MRNGVAPRGEGRLWFIFFWIVMPTLAYNRWGGWLGIVLYLLLLAVLGVSARFVITRIRGVPFL